MRQRPCTRHRRRLPRRLRLGSRRRQCLPSNQLPVNRLPANLLPTSPHSLRRRSPRLRLRLRRPFRSRPRWHLRSRPSRVCRAFILFSTNHTDHFTGPSTPTPQQPEQPGQPTQPASSPVSPEQPSTASPVVPIATGAADKTSFNLLYLLILPALVAAFVL